MRYCSIASGSSGNCHFIENAGVRVLVDAGLSLKAIEAGLRRIGVEPSTIRAVFVTHEHIDHVKSVKSWNRRYHVPVFATAGCWEAIDRMKSLGEMERSQRYTIRSGGGYYLEKLRVEPFATFHDVSESVGYVFEGEGKLVVMTDTGTVSAEMAQRLEKADLAAIECNHDVEMLMNGPYPYPLKKRVRSNLGHLSNDDCAALAVRLLESNSACRICLSHLSQENNTPQVALGTVLNALHRSFGQDRFDEQVRISPRGALSPLYELMEDGNVRLQFFDKTGTDESRSCQLTLSEESMGNDTLHADQGID